MRIRCSYSSARSRARHGWREPWSVMSAGLSLTGPDLLKPGQTPQGLDAGARSQSAGDEHPGRFRCRRRSIWLREASGFRSWRGLRRNPVRSSIPEQRLVISPPSPQKKTAVDALRTIEIFSDLRDDQLKWFASSAQELRFSPGDLIVHEGDPADALFVLLEGEVRGRRENGIAAGFAARAGQVIGMLPFSRMTKFPLTVRAAAPTWASRPAQRLLPGNAAANSGAATAADRRTGGSNSRIQPCGTATRQAERAGQAFGGIGSRAEQSCFRGAASRGGAPGMHAGAPEDQ